MQNLFTFKFINFANWEWPGFPSLMVPYGKNSDFYISGHTGFFIVMIGEMHLLGVPWYFKLMAFFFLMYEMLVLLIYRQHYSIDIISGLLYSFWVHLQAQQIAPTMDRLFARLRVWFVSRYMNHKDTKQIGKENSEHQSRESKVS